MRQKYSARSSILDWSSGPLCVVYFLLTVVFPIHVDAAVTKGNDGHDMEPAMIDLDWSDFKDMKRHLGLKENDKIGDLISQQLISFEYVAKSGVHAAFFQTTYGTNGKPGPENFDAGRHLPDDGTDESFRVWGAQAQQAGLLIGCYHYFHPISNESPEMQADLFLKHITYICAQHPNVFLNKKILLAFDAKNEEAPDKEVDDIWRFAAEIHKQAAVWPGFYPETGDATDGGITNDTYYSAFGRLDQNKREDLSKCWLWLPRYDLKGITPDKYSLEGSGRLSSGLFFGIWKKVTFWQYYGAEYWDAKADETPYVSMFNQTTCFPISAAGAVIPFDCSYFLQDGMNLSDLWNSSGWVAWPASAFATSGPHPYTEDPPYFDPPKKKS